MSTLPEYRKRKNAMWQQLQKVAERWRLHRWIGPTFPTYDVTSQLTYFRGIAELTVCHSKQRRRVRFRQGHTTAGVFNYLSDHKTYEWRLTNVGNDNAVNCDVCGLQNNVE